MNTLNYQNIFAEELLDITDYLSCSVPIIVGKVVRVVGLTIEVIGLSVEIGAQCQIHVKNGKDKYIDAEVVGFNESKTYLMSLQTIDGIKPGSLVRILKNDSDCQVGEELIGRVIDGQGNPIDNKGPINFDHTVALDGQAINPLERGKVKDILDTGVKAINSALTFGEGQRVGLIAGSGVGKSVLLGMLARNTNADVVIIGLIGERGREVQEFIQNTLGEDGLKKSIVVAAPIDVSSVMRIKAAKYSHAIAEYFAGRGKKVLLLFDSLTRVAHAQREIGLATGEPPTTKGYTPSVFGLIPKLIERAGMGKNNHGSISAFYTVLAESDDKNDPIVDLSRATLDGQIMLSRSLADSAHYPAIDLEGSISRLASTLLNAKQFTYSQKLRKYWTLYKQKEDLIQVGAYAAGSDKEIDMAIKIKSQIDKFLVQDSHEKVLFDDSMENLINIMDSNV